MKFIINNEQKSKIPTTKLYDLGTDVEIGIDNLLDFSIITIDQNTIPVLKINDSNYLINNFNPNDYKEDFEILLTESDLISFSSGESGDFIPLTGTEVGSPVSGNIEFGNNNNLFNNNIGEDNSSTIGFEEGVISLYNTNNPTSYTGSLRVGTTNINIENNNPLSRGLISSYDYTANITDLDYTQKKYVDQKVADSRPYKVYTALLRQSGTDAPVATVLENTLGDIVWSRDNVGTYLGTLMGAFPENKYFAPISPAGLDSGGDPYIYYRLDDNQIIINTIDNALLYAPIEIRVYN